MVDLLNDLYAWLRRGDGVPTQLAAFIVIRIAVKLVSRRTRAFGDLNGGNLEVVLGLTRSVCAKEQTMGRVWLVGWSMAPI